jgi:hypothetical protein
LDSINYRALNPKAKAFDKEVFALSLYIFKLQKECQSFEEIQYVAPTEFSMRQTCRSNRLTNQLIYRALIPKAKALDGSFSFG